MRDGGLGALKSAALNRLHRADDGLNLCWLKIEELFIIYTFILFFDQYL